jgi:hypothetical protein
MKRNVVVAVLSLCCCVAARGATPPKLDDPAEGQKLAREMRRVGPAEEVKLKGVLRLGAPKSEPRELPVEMRIAPGAGSWKVTYSARLPGGKTESLTVRHSADKPNEYEWRRGESVQQLTGASATNKFANSDFALFDLGLEFFHWPTQILVTREMRKGRGCDVLESRPSITNLYSRVLSWIDQDTRTQGNPGLLMAEAYDERGAILKEFEIKSIKDNQVSEMEIRNRQTKTSTRLQFSFEEK